MSGNSGEVNKMLPEGGELGTYVTILDLKERWMKKKQQEEEDKRQMQLKEAEKERGEEENKNVCERLDVLNIVCVEDRDEARCAGVRHGRWNSRARGRGGRSSEGSNSQIEKRKGNVEKIEDKNKGFEADDVRVNGDDLLWNNSIKVGGSGRGRHPSRMRLSRDGISMKGMVSDVTENVGIDVEKGEEVDSIGDEKGTRTNCPCHSKSENQGGGGFWVCKYVEPAPRAGSLKIVTGTDVVDRGIGMVDYARKKNGGKEILQQLEKHRVSKRVIEEMAAAREKEDAMRVNGDISSDFHHDNVSRKIWQQPEKLEMSNGVKKELTVIDTRKNKMAVYKDIQRMINHDGTCEKNDVKLQLQTVEPSDEIEEHCQVSSVTERERIRKGKFRARDCPIEGKKIYDSGRFKAEKNIGLLPMDCVIKDSVQVNSSYRKMINHVGSQRTIDSSGLKLENTEPLDCLEKSESLLCTEMGENSSVSLTDTRNGMYSRKTFVNKRLQNARIVSNERLTNSGKSYYKRERRLERENFMWVKKGEASVGDAGRRT